MSTTARQFRSKGAYSATAHFMAVAFMTVVMFAAFTAPIIFSTHGTPGDLGDARFNIYVLEHSYQWLIGTHTDFFSPPIFFPFQNVLLLSETHVGSSAFYVLFRLLGASEYNAFTLWYMLGFFLTLWATHYIMARVSFSPLVAAFGAAFFAFSLPSIAQMTHAQLVFRVGVPLAFFYTFLALKDRDIFSLITAIFWICVQVLIGIYLGVFLTILIAFFIVSYICFDRSQWQWKAVFQKITFDLMRINWSPSSRKMWLVVSTLGIVVATLALLIAYAQVSKEYNIARPWGEVQSMLPRPASYLLMDLLPYWQSLRIAGDSIPMRHEHQLFIGLGTLILFLLGCWQIARRAPHLENWVFFASSLSALLIAILLITPIFGIYLYKMLFWLPGLNSIRAVSRISVVLMFPVALLASLGAKTILDSAATRQIASLIVFICFAFFVYEVASVKKHSFSAAQAEMRIENIVAEAAWRGQGIDQPILHVFRPEAKQPVKLELDAMHASLRLGWPTLNGYSGWYPRWPSSRQCAQSQLMPNVVSQIHDASGAIAEKISLDQIVVVGARESRDLCIFKVRHDIDESAAHEARSPPTTGLPRAIKLRQIGATQLDGLIAVTIGITNTGDETLWSGAFNGADKGVVSFGWRFLREPQDATSVGWSNRLGLPFDIPAKGSELVLTFFARPPKQTGNYKLQISMVSEHQFWFHNKGMKILSIQKDIQVP